MGYILPIGIITVLLLLNVEARDTAVCGGKPADVVFILDASTSIWGPNYDKQLAFVQDVVGEFDVRPMRTQCGLLTFSDYVRVEFNLRSYTDKRTMKHAIGRTSQLLGGTRTDLALKRMRKMFDADHRRGVPKLAVVMTDGESTYTDLTALQAKLTHEAGITVFAIGIGENVDKIELQMIATSADYVFEVDSYDALNSIRKMLAIKACAVEEAQQADQVAVTPPTKGCDGKPADVVFALDASSSIWEMDFDRQLNFVRDVVSIFEISRSATRVGVLTFGDDVQRQFYLDEYLNEVQLTKAIAAVGQSRGNTNTAEAIRAIREQFFAPRRARQGVVHIGIIITDGRSDNPTDTAIQAELTRRAGVQLFAVGVGKHVDQRELYNIASQPAGQYVFEVNTYEALGSVKNLLAIKTCEVTEIPTTPKPIPTTKPTTTPKPTTTTTATPPPTGCSPQLPADIIFAMPPDVSDSESDHVLKFVRNVTSDLDIDSSAVRFGLIPKHCYTVPGFGLSEGGLSKKDVVSKISSTVFRQVESAEIIKHICDVSFQEVQGARRSSQKIGVLFVDTRGSAEQLARTADAVSRAEQLGIQLVIIGVGGGVSPDQLSQLVSPQLEKNMLLIQDYSDLTNVAGAMLRRFDQLCVEPFFKVFRH